MFNLSQLHQLTFARVVAICALLLVIALATSKSITSHSAARARQIEAVYHRDRLWPKDNPQPKPTLYEVLPEAAILAKTSDYLRQSRALELFWRRPTAADELQAKPERMARQTQLTRVLDEFWAAIGNDPFVTAECQSFPRLSNIPLEIAAAVINQENDPVKYFGVQGPGPVAPVSNRSSGVARTNSSSKDFHSVERLQQSLSSDTLKLNASFTGIDMASGFDPADSSIATGPNSLILITNAGAAIRSRTGALVATAPIGQFPSLIRNTNSVGDPKVLYDLMSSRFFVIANGTSFDNPNCLPGSCVASLYLAVSKTSNPATFDASDWFFYVFDATLDGITPTSNWADFPSLGVNDQVVVIAAQMISFGDRANVGSKLLVLEKSKLVKGEAVTRTDFFGMRDPINGSLAYSFRAATHFGSQLTFFLLSHSLGDACRLVVWGIENPLSSPTLLARSTTVSDGRCRNPPPAPQPGIGTKPLFAGANNLQGDTIYRNGSLWMPRVIAHNFGNGEVAAIRWFQIGVNSWPDSVSLIQDHTFGADGIWHTFPALSVDESNNLVMVFNRASSSEFASVYYTGRRSSDPSNTLGASILLKAGSTSLTPNPPDTSSQVPFADYSGISLDPSDNSFWIFGEYAKASNAWGTWVGNVSFCNFALSSTSQSFGINGGTDSVKITALDGCTWTATSNAPWLTITSGASGAGTGTVNCSVATNTTGRPRTSTLTIGGQTLTITQSGENPVPILSSLQPNAALAGGDTFTLTVMGAGYVNGATIRWNGMNRTTNFVSATQLTAQILASDLLILGTATVTVFNPAPGGGVSTAVSFTVGSSLSSVSAASFGGAQLAPESIVAAFGTGLATQTLAATVVPLPTILAGTTVTVRGSSGAERFAPLFFVSRDQVNYLVPAGTADGAATVTVTSGDGKLSIGAAQVVSVAPGLFAANANGQGVAAAVALRVRGESQIYEPVAQFDTASGRFVTAPIDLGPVGEQVFLVLYGSGIRNRSSLSTASCKIGGLDTSVLFAAAAEGFVGLDQVNVGPLPRSLAGLGEVDVVLIVDGKMANPVQISVK